MNDREFNAAMSAILESVGPDVYNAVIDEANNNLDTIEGISMDEAVALAAVTLSDDGVISEGAYGTIDAVMEAYGNQVKLEALAEAVDEDTFETIVNATNQVMQECGCDISEALDAVLDEAGLEYGPMDEDMSKAAMDAALAKAVDAQKKSGENSASPGTGEVDWSKYTGNNTQQPAPKKGFKLKAPNLKGAAGAVGNAFKSAGRGTADVFTGRKGRLAQGGAIAGSAAVLGGGGYLAYRHIKKKREERKAAEARAAAEARKPLNRLKAAVAGKGKKAANEAATNAMEYLMECSGY